MGCVAVQHLYLHPPAQGAYTCTATNIAGTEALTATISLAQEPPRVSLEPRGRLVVREGAQLTVTCRVAGAEHAAVTWAAHSDTRRDLRHVVRGDQLILEHVARGDEGTYVCSASNAAGTGRDSVMLVVEAGPASPPWGSPAPAPGYYRPPSRHSPYRSQVTQL